MKTSHAAEELSRIAHGETEASTLSIVVQAQGEIGGLPTVPVKSIQAGFDWEAGRVLLFPEKPLTLLTPEDVAAIHASASAGQSWHAYQQYKALKARYEGEILALKARLAELDNPWHVRASDHARNG